MNPGNSGNESRFHDASVGRIPVFFPTRPTNLQPLKLIAKIPSENGNSGDSCWILLEITIFRCELLVSGRVDPLKIHVYYSKKC